MKRCPECNAELPLSAKFCFNCGAPQPTPRTSQKARPVHQILVDLEGDLTQQLTEQFFLSLKQRVQEEHQADKFQRYSERIYESGFRDTIARRNQQLVEFIEAQKAKGTVDLPYINGLIDRTFYNLIDYFIISFCKDLNEIELPEAILKYQKSKKEEVNFYQMVMDYLQLDQESEKIYTDFLSMPVEKLKNISKSFLFPERDEKIILICDTTLFQNGKEGFALTERGIYWKAPFQKAQLAYFDKLTTITRKEDWILINGHFFNVNRSLNLKMLKLLKKIQRMGY